MTDDMFDFGFVAVDEDDLSSVQSAAAIQEEALVTQERLDKLYNAIIPLLNNLKKNPEKEYILWPDRLQKVEEFESRLLDIYEG